MDCMFTVRRGHDSGHLTTPQNSQIDFALFLIHYAGDVDDTYVLLSS